MANQPAQWRFSLAGCFLGLTVSFLPSAQPAVASEEAVIWTKDEAPPLPTWKVAKADSLRLSDCIRIGLETQPALKAAHASLGSAESAQEGLRHLRVVGLLSREIPIRRKQAALGVDIASAGVSQAEHEATYAVTRNFFSAQYAQLQRKIAQDVIDNLKATHAAAKGQVDAGSRTTTENDLKKIKIFQAMAEIRLQDAVTGHERALAALREAMGVGRDFPLNLAEVGLPLSSLEPSRDQVVSLALARRGEMVQIVELAEVICLEVEAQGTTYSLTARTFAAGADIHARPIPQGERNGKYRPDALGVEMPTTLAGHRRDRMNRARELNDRAQAVVDKTRNLITLEAEDSFLKWQEATAKLAKIKEAAKDGIDLGKNTQKDFTAGAKVSVKDVLDALVLGQQTQSLYNETLYNQVLSLAALERVTAGGLKPGWSLRK